MKLSKYFTLEEFTYSQIAERKGLDNTPPEALLPRIQRTARGLDGIRELTGFPIFLSSGYRSMKVNRAVGGVSSSQHVQGEAADIRCPGYGDSMRLASLIDQNKRVLGVDQVILEYGRWVHVSFSDRPRYETLSVYRGTGYMPGIKAAP